MSPKKKLPYDLKLKMTKTFISLFFLYIVMMRRTMMVVVMIMVVVTSVHRTGSVYKGRAEDSFRELIFFFHHEGSGAGTQGIRLVHQVPL